LALLGFGLYGAFLTGRAQRLPAAAPLLDGRTLDLRNQTGMSADGRFGTKCGRGPNDLCRVPFVRLIASPGDYQGQRIIVAGFLAIGTAGVALYPTRDSAKFDAGDAIWLEDDRGIIDSWPRFIPEAMWPQLEEGLWVTAIGTFDAVHLKKFRTAAVLRDVERVEDIPEYRFRALPIVPPSPKLKSISPVPESPPQFETLPAKP
jgi:hypothetical protein